MVTGMNSKQFRKRIRDHTPFRSADELFTMVLMQVGRQSVHAAPDQGWERWESDWEYHNKVQDALAMIAPRLPRSATATRFVAWQTWKAHGQHM